MNSFFFGKKHAWFGLVLLGFGLVILIDGWREAQDARRLNISGQAATVIVTDMRTAEDRSAGRDTITGSGNTQTSYYLKYRLQILGIDEIYERKVPRAFFDAHPTGSEIAIRVLPRDPDVHALFEGELKKNSTGALIVGFVLSIFGAVVFWLKGGFDRFRRNVQNV